MKIIKSGDKEKARCVKRFECYRCGCIFEADNTEYETKMNFENEYHAVINCPTCDARLYK